MSKIKVNLGSRSYDIVIGTNILPKLASYIHRYSFSKIVVITDSNVNKLYAKAISKALAKFDVLPIIIPAGEKHKNLYTASAVYDMLVAESVHRDALIVAFGGGVIGDLAGFVAATYMRGVPFIQVPTTLLAQVDASIGGKTGVDHKNGKNLIGAFYQPKLVFIDTQLLNTLPPREVKTGLAEVVKYGVIKDKNIFDMLLNNPKATSKFWEEIITRCAKIKAEVVSKDEYEKTGLRMILNLGHTFGHAIEAVSGFSRYTHGEAIALGMSAAARLSYKLGILKPDTLSPIETLLSKLKLPLSTDLPLEKVFKALMLDKKVKSKKIRFVLPVSIGEVVIRDNVPEKLIKETLKEIGCS